jgi:hypothetical protein
LYLHCRTPELDSLYAYVSPEQKYTLPLPSIEGELAMK